MYYDLTGSFFISFFFTARKLSFGKSCYCREEESCVYVGSMLSICGGLGVGLAVFFYTREYVLL